jgi:hypothetical protein
MHPFTCATALALRLAYLGGVLDVLSAGPIQGPAQSRQFHCERDVTRRFRFAVFMKRYSVSLRKRKLK